MHKNKKIFIPKFSVLHNKLSCQKLSALLKQLVDSNKVIKTIEKRVSYFSLPKEEEEEETEKIEELTEEAEEMTEEEEVVEK